ncbi:MAG: nucleoside-diphosphate kinase [bacterium]|nr:nucleoside-diphosphate kinase [bacterium]
MANIKERTLIILKPDALHRGLVGEILDRFEQKGLRPVGMKMIKMSDLLLDKHYAQHKGKHFLPKLKKFMKSLPVVLVVLEGLDVVRVVRTICGPTDGKNAPAGTIRGDYGMSISNNIIHSSEDLKASKREIAIFFSKNELFNYQRPDIHFYYAEDEI